MGFFEGVFVDSEKYPELNQVLADLAEKYGTTKTGIASAWIFRHPAKIQMVAGTTNLKRFAGDRAGGRYPADQRRMVSVIFKCGTYTAIEF